MNTAKISNNHNANPVDRLGALKAQAADLEAQIKKITDELKKQGAGEYEGDLFRVKIAEVPESESYDSKAKIKAGYLRLTVTDR